MCGRYASTRPVADLARAFDVRDDRTDPQLPADYNMAPTKRAPVIIAQPPREDRDAPAERQVRNLTWGLVPSWAKDRAIGSRMINARAETVAEKPSYRRAFSSRRALVPVDGFYEWLPTERIGKGGKPLKQPYFIHPADPEEPLALAGIFEYWHDDHAEDGTDPWLVTYAVITTTATDDVGRVHDRMPMAVTAEHWEAWLDPATDAATAQDLMAAPELGSLDMYAISTLVNNVRNNGPDLLKPAPEITAETDAEAT
ncbi:SOS response-associated peptidase [Tersicoccus sp. MR15.9]|uniref:SOS response-associated peptidase n=1 Tax=Tersicoccus mangrovi TaxID=3121635 RepID=UPI002FE61C93